MVSYEELEATRIGQQVMADERNSEQIEGQIAAQSNENALTEQELAENGNDAANEEAMSVLEEMQRIESEGGDAIAFLETLPPELQERVYEIMGSMQQPPPEEQRIGKI
jgi:hypothetical protein